MSGIRMSQRDVEHGSRRSAQEPEHDAPGGNGGDESRQPGRPRQVEEVQRPVEAQCPNHSALPTTSCVRALRRRRWRPLRQPNAELVAEIRHASGDGRDSEVRSRQPQRARSNRPPRRPTRRRGRPRRTSPPAGTSGRPRAAAGRPDEPVEVLTRRIHSGHGSRDEQPASSAPRAGRMRPSTRRRAGRRARCTRAALSVQRACVRPSIARAPSRGATPAPGSRQRR